MINRGKFLRTKRKEKGLSIRQLAKFTGVSPAYISQIENNDRKNPTAHVLRSLAYGLGIDEVELLLQFDMLSEDEIKERRQFYHDQVIMNQTMQEKDNPIDLYDVLTNEENVYYKGHLLHQTERDKVLTMLQTLLE